MMIKYLCISWVALGLITGCSSVGIRGEKKITAASSGSIPDWVRDSSNDSQRKMIKNYDDNSDQPKFFYVVSQAHVDDESLVPGCYDFARANATNELASSVSQEVKSAVSSASDTSSDSKYAVSTVESKTALVGAEVLDRYWEKTQDRDLQETVNCYIVTAIPMKNFEALKKIAINKAAGKTEMDKKTKENAEKTQSED